MRVGLFITCLTDTFYPRVGEAVVRVLRHFGCRVEFPAEQTCCGQPAFNSGCLDEVPPLARRMADVFAPYDYVVTPSASCAAMVKQHYPEVLDSGSDAVAVRDLGQRTYEFGVFLRDVLGLDAARHLRFAEPITYHYPCHARGIYTPEDLAGWLAADGADCRHPRLADLCCGFGGVFAVDQPEISTAMLREKLDMLAATGARTVICNEAGCGLHLSGGASRTGVPLRFRHLAECLAESLGLLEPLP